MLELVIATANPHKVEEMAAIFATLLPQTAVRLVSLSELPASIDRTEPTESGTTFEQNATIKAEAYSLRTGLPCLADDSGLEIDALGGKPGVISSHYCTDGNEAGMSRAQRDVANNLRVMRELGNLPGDKRAARFVCVMCLAGLRNSGGTPIPTRCFRGTFEGRIGRDGEVPRGSSGFGYDPLFLVGPEYRVTSAELAPEQKNVLSHRAASARLVAQYLASWARGR